jgi:hypothetical protein
MAPAAYGEARERERNVVLPDRTTYAGRTPGALAARRAHGGAHDGKESRRRYRDADT